MSLMFYFCACLAPGRSLCLGGLFLFWPELQKLDISSILLNFRDPSSESPRACCSPAHHRISSTRKKRRVIVLDDSLPRGTEGPICRPDPSHREVWCLPGTQVSDAKRKVSNLVQPSDHYYYLQFRCLHQNLSVEASSTLLENRPPMSILRGP